MTANGMKKGAIILCGGHSRRMGRDKASLPFGPESMLLRVVRLISQVVPPSNIVVVTSGDRELPSLPEGIVIAHDRRTNRGPLEGFLAGLKVSHPAIDAVFTTSCDVPLISPTFVGQMFESLGSDDIAVPGDGSLVHPLAGVYRPSVVTIVEQLLAADELRFRSLFDHVRTRMIPVEQLREFDPPLGSLMNLNSPDDYRTALNLAKISLDETINATFNSPDGSLT